MKKTAFVSSALAVLFASVTAHAEAQVTVDVSKITCDQFVEYKIADPKQIATWIDGYYHGAHGSSMLDAQEMLEIINTVEEHCFKHPGDLVMRSVEGLWGPGNSRPLQRFKAFNRQTSTPCAFLALQE